MEISFRMRKPAPGLLPNLIGVLGLIGIAVSIGALVGNWWWSALAGGVFAVAIAYLAGSVEPAPAAKVATASNVATLPKQARA